MSVPDLNPIDAARRRANRTRDLACLWHLRILLRLGAFERLCCQEEGRGQSILREALGDEFAVFLDQGIDATRAYVETYLVTLEQRRKKLNLRQPLAGNLETIAKYFAINSTEAQVLALAVLLSDDDAMNHAGAGTRPSTSISVQVAKVLGIGPQRAMSMLALGSQLRRTGLLNVLDGNELVPGLRVVRGNLRWMTRRRCQNMAEAFRRLIREASGPTLSARHYEHVLPSVDSLRAVLVEALSSRRSGVNVLLHGPPGTGKTELSRTLALLSETQLYEVAPADEDGSTVEVGERLSQLATAQGLLKCRRALLCFDEIDALFSKEPGVRGSTADRYKVWLNELLEHNAIPTIWIANSIQAMDPAFLRRFDVVCRLDVPPRAIRRRILQDAGGQDLSDLLMDRLAEVEGVSPASLVRTVAVAQRVAASGSVSLSAAVRGVLSGLLEAQGRSPLRADFMELRDLVFDPALCNASVDLRELADGMRRGCGARLCLYGPPGTGKTAFGRWLAEELGRPHLLRRVSDLQSPWLGEMERKLARTFQEAEAEGAVLQIDEVDSFLRDRRSAERSWEVSQVNEFLTQLESYRGLFIASTNLFDDLDPAALRRFDFRVRLDPLRANQAAELAARCMTALGIEPSAATLGRVREIQALVPSDFEVIARRHRIAPFSSATEVIDALAGEAATRSQQRRIGFIQ
jgi:transitional endoplasmic reticulum ATPase